jgi:hypothetical protein
MLPAEQGEPVSSAGGDSHRNAPVNHPSGERRINLRLPWRADEFEQTHTGPLRDSSKLYFVLDRAGIVIAIFGDLQIAQAMVAIVNGFAGVQKEMWGRD